MNPSGASACAALLVLLVVLIPQAYAHPFTEDTVPAKFSNAPEGTTKVIVYYSEGIEIGFSELEVLNSKGEDIDLGDTAYYENERSLIVTVPPLSEGIYTVKSKVLSSVDGHLVPDAFVFSVGDVVLSDTEIGFEGELIFYPEAGAKFPGLVGQTIFLGSIIASLLLWEFLRIGHGKGTDPAHRHYYRRLMSLLGVGIVAVFVSNILLLAIHMWRLEASSLDVIQTSWGTTWIIRMSITVVLLGAWFALERSGRLHVRGQMFMLGASLVLIGTTTMMGHGAASELPQATVLDYIHNLVSAVWIGGVIFLAFVLVPALGRMDADLRERWDLAAIPRFTAVAAASIVVVVVTGPLLMYLLESNIGTVTESTYGKLIIVKILLASAMVAIGGYHRKMQRQAESGSPIHKRFRRALRVEAGLGVAILLVVAILTNSTLPAGEIHQAQAHQEAAGLSVIEFSENVRFEVDMMPFSTGVNRITVKPTGLEGLPLSDVRSLKVKTSNPGAGVAPIEVPVEVVPEGAVPAYRGETTFGFSGAWQVEIEVQRTQGTNEGVTLNLPVKPRLENIEVEIVEYDFPESGAPLYPVYDGDGSIWISDASAPVIWQYAIESGEFTRHEFSGEASIILDIDSSGRIWFTDTPEGQIGHLDPKTGNSEKIDLPALAPRNADSIPIFIDVTPEDAVWVTVVNKNAILRYDADTGRFETFILPTEDSVPFAVAAGPDNRVWFVQQAVGQLGYIDPDTGDIREFAPEIPLKTPETITFDHSGNLWISEHQEGGGIARFNPILERFERVASPSANAFPNDAVLDRYGNVWFAGHTVDALAVYDPLREEIMEVRIPTEESWVQFTVSDGDGNVWFVEQKPQKLAMVETTERIVHHAPVTAEDAAVVTTSYAVVAGPLMAGGVVAFSLFFVSGLRDARRLRNKALERSTPP